MISDYRPVARWGSITYMHILYKYTYMCDTYMSIRVNQVHTQCSAETVSLCSNSKITLLAIILYQNIISPVLLLGTHFFIVLAMLFLRVWPSKVGVIVKILI